MKSFLILCLVLHVSFAQEWKTTKSISLKKDQLERLLVKSDGSQRLLEFRWTLYANNVLVVLRNFDDIVTQHALKLNHTNQSVRIELLAHTAYKIKVPYLLIKFTEFDYKKNESKFDIFLFDKEEEIELEYLKNE
ncbi:MAG: hypothetical protein U9R50_03165 [Campylobacterota bacterium]|nr:hypothetical protein [Campylobacterota bacterium]